nr:hypothetical protein [Tanacetum cinerariifolium]
LPSLEESLPSVPDAYGQPLKALPSQSAASGSESHVPDAVEAHNKLPDSIPSNNPKPLEKYRPLPSQSVWSPDGLSYPP